MEDNSFGAVRLFRYSFIPYFYLFLSGVLMQRLNASKSGLIAGKALYWFILYVVFSCFVPLTYAATSIAGNLILAIFTISMAYTASGFSHRVLRGNDISYGVYIYHGLIINILVQLHYTGQWKYVAVLLPIAFSIALFSWKFIEEPMLRRKKKTINIQLKENGEAGIAYQGPHSALPKAEGPELEKSGVVRG